MPFYRKILKQAIVVTWQNKYLWFFGLFAALIGSGGIYEVAVRTMPGSGALESFRSIRDTGLFRFDTLRNLGAVILNDPVSTMLVLSLLFVVFVLLIFFIWMAIVSQSALINSAGLYAGGKDSNFQDSVNCGTHKFWPVLTINIFTKAAVYIFSFLAIWILALGGFEATPLSFTAMLVSISVTITVSFALKYALGFLIIRGEGVLSSVYQGIKLFKDNFLVSLEMAFILFLVNLLIAYVTSVIVVLMSAPLLLMMELMVRAASSAGFWVMFIVALVAILTFIATMVAASTAFHVSAWTTLFTELVSRGGKSKLIRMLTKQAEE